MTFVDPLTMAGKGYSRTKNIISEKKNKTKVDIDPTDTTGQICDGGGHRHLLLSPGEEQRVSPLSLSHLKCYRSIFHF